ncbi:glycosyltransferase family 4 protein [Lentisalinibacter salinarum]|uniref:glycosyltransferase family 4 protein n=1 Tax=Lentisalinibacter salinarum TaxID=2992239 RepID=UPI00386ECC94
MLEDGTETVRITHINLARGFRGGENQTLLLIRELAARGWRQQFIGRAGEPLALRLRDTPGLTVTPVGGVLGAAVRVQAQLVHAHEARAAQAAWIASKLRGCRYVLTRRVMRPPSQTWLTERIYRDAETVVALSRAIAGVLRQRFPTIESVVIPSALLPVRPDPGAVAEIRSRYPEPFLVGNVAALDIAKGQLELIEAARRLSGRREGFGFLFVGTGDDATRIQDAARGMDNVHFAGFVDNVEDYIAALDVFAFPSHHEGLGSVLLQAMHTGVPIVATETGGIPELVVNEETGLLVPVCDADALAAAIERLRDDPGAGRKIAERAAVRLSEFTPGATADRYERLYRHSRT